MPSRKTLAMAMPAAVTDVDGIELFDVPYTT